MSDLRELYQQLIIDHGRKPRNFGPMAGATQVQQGFNPLCGDKITLYLLERNGVIEDVKFEGAGCAISMASASMMSQALRGKSVAEAKHLFTDFHELVTEGSDAASERLGKLGVLKGVCEYPARVKCATLCWHTLLAALEHRSDVVNTESTP